MDSVQLIDRSQIRTINKYKNLKWNVTKIYFKKQCLDQDLVCRTEYLRSVIMYVLCVKWVPVTMAWRILRLQMEERPPVMEGSCAYIE
jgi:hypothetical protein